MLDESNPVQGRLSLRVVWRIAFDISTLQLGELVTVFAEALDKVELFSKDLAENVEFVEADEVGVDEGDGFVALPLVVATFFLGGCQSSIGDKTKGKEDYQFVYDGVIRVHQ